MDVYDWYKKIIFYLQYMKDPLEMGDNQNRALKLQAIRYVIVRGMLWWINMQGVPLKCINEKHSITIPNEMHGGVYGGHYMAKTIAHKVIREGFWQSTLF